LIGDGWCHDGDYNTDACGYDGEDCSSSNCLVEDVEHLGDGVCNDGTYNTPQCGHDAGDCKSTEHFLECGSSDIDDIDEELGMAFVTLNTTPLNVGLMVWTASNLMQIIRCVMLSIRRKLATHSVLARKVTTT